MTLHDQLEDAIGAEPPLGSPHAAVRRRVGQLRRRRQATGAVVGAAGIAAAAVAMPALRSHDRGASPVSAHTSFTETPLVNSWPESGGRTCEVATQTGTDVAGVSADALHIEGAGLGLDARRRGEDAQIPRMQPVDLHAALTPGANVRGIGRILIGLDPVAGGKRVWCVARGATGAAVPHGGTLTVTFPVPAGAVPPGTYKGVVLSSYSLESSYHGDFVGYAAEAELGFYTFS